VGRTVAIDCFSDRFNGWREGHTTVAIDVIRATTTAVTGVSLGRRCFPAATLEDALRLAEGVDDALLVGELGGAMPYGFDITNSPAELAARRDTERPMVLLSTSGTRLITAGGENVFVACLRNYRAQIEALVHGHPRVSVVGAGTRGEFREEDQLCCAWIAEGLVSRGYEPEDENTRAIIARWSGAPVDAIASGKSSSYLCRTGQTHDLDFILDRIDDLDEVFAYFNGEIAQAK
jgi:2-phosphosulfolactate phosphatase